MTKRKFTLYTLIVGILIWAGPYFVGRYLEAKYYVLAGRLSEFQGTSVTPISYERHWRFSTVKTKVHIKDLGWQQILTYGQNPLEAQLKNLPPLEFTLESKIYHGPIANVSGRWFDWKFVRAEIRSLFEPSEELKKIMNLQTADKHLAVNSSMDLFDGELRMHLLEQMPAAHKAKVEVGQDIEGFWTFDSALTSLNAEVFIPSINLVDGHHHYLVEQIRFKTQRSRLPGEFWQGTGELSIGHVDYEGPEVLQGFQADNLHVQGDVSVNQGLTNSKMTLAFEHLWWRQKSYGPLYLDLGLNHIPQDIFQLWQALTQSQPEQGSMLIQHYLLNEYVLVSMPRLLAARPSIQCQRVDLNGPEGRLQGRFDFAIGGKNAFNPMKPQELLNSVEVSAELSVPKPILEELIAFYFEQLQPSRVVAGDEATSKLVFSTIQEWKKQGFLVEKPETKTYWIQLSVEPDSVVSMRDLQSNAKA